MPYPGARPEFSFCHIDHEIHRLDGDWRFDLARDLEQRGEPSLAEREHLLAYGSNVCPSKIGWMRAELGLRGTVIVLRATCTGLAAVWAAGHRVVDDQRPATLTAAPDTTETHAVWLATADQVKVLDRCEGRGERYRLVRLHSGRIELEDGTRVEDPLAYVGLAARRLPLLVDGAPVRCTDVRQVDAMGLTGRAASSDGLDVTELAMRFAP